MFYMESSQQYQEFFHGVLDVHLTIAAKNILKEANKVEKNEDKYMEKHSLYKVMVDLENSRFIKKQKKTDRKVNSKLTHYYLADYLSIAGQFTDKGSGCYQINCCLHFNIT